MHYGFVVMVALFTCSCSSTIYLVRHAEKANATADTELSPAGFKRANALKDSLKGVRLQAVFATEYRRTLQTVAPAAELALVTVTRYRASMSDSLIIALSQKKHGKYLVAGHSNTVPAMLRKIGLHPSMQDIPDNDYDNLFVVSVKRFFGKKIRLAELHYGAVSP